MIKDWLWEHVVFHLICTKDEDHKHTGGGRVRDNKLCRYIARSWN